MSKRWYVVQAYSGFEKNVQKTLKERIVRENMEDYFGQILVPVEEVVDIKNGRKTISERKFYPGYVLVEMEMTDDSWHLVKSTPRVNGFVGGSGNRARSQFLKKMQMLFCNKLKQVLKSQNQKLSLKLVSKFE